MKRVMNILIILVLLLCCCSCGQNKADTTDVLQTNAKDIYTSFIKPLYAADEILTTDDLARLWGVEFWSGASSVDLLVNNIPCEAWLNTETDYSKSPNISYVDSIDLSCKLEDYHEREKIMEAVNGVISANSGDMPTAFSGYYNIAYSSAEYGIISIELKEEHSIALEAAVTGKSTDEIVQQRNERAAKASAVVDEARERARQNIESEYAIEKNREWLITAAQKAVRSQLSDPGSADFPFYSDSYPIIDMGDGIYAVTVEVEHKNNFGGTVNSTFVVRLKGDGINNYSIVGVARM